MIDFTSSAKYPDFPGHAFNQFYCPFHKFLGIQGEMASGLASCLHASFEYVARLVPERGLCSRSFYRKASSKLTVVPVPGVLSTIRTEENYMSAVNLVQAVL